MKRFLLIIPVLLSISHLFAEQLVLQSALKLDSSEDMLASGLVVHDRIFMLHRRNAQIYVFNETGKLLSKSGKKGEGPGELLSPSKMAYHNDKILLGDSQRQGFYQIQLKNNELGSPTFHRTGSNVLSLALFNDKMMTTGEYRFFADLLWWSSQYSLADVEKSHRPLISYMQLWNIDSNTEVMNEYRQKTLLNSNTFCTIYDNLAFACDQRNLRIMSVNLKTYDVKAFGEHGKYHKKIPVDEKAIQDMYAKMDSNGLLKEWDKVPANIGLFATQKYLFLVFRTPYVNKQEKHILQKYSQQGILISEYILSDTLKPMNGENRRYLSGFQATHGFRDDSFYCFEYYEDSDGEPIHKLYQFQLKR